jgi:hypothetical protein
VLQRCGVVKLQRYLTKNEYMKKENISAIGGGEYKFTSTAADGETETTHLSMQQLIEILHFEISIHAESIDPNLKNVIPLDKWELELESSGLFAIRKLGASTTESVIEYYKIHSPSVSKYIQSAFDPAITDEMTKWLALRDALRDEVQRRQRIAKKDEKLDRLELARHQPLAKGINLRFSSTNINKLFVESLMPGAMKEFTAVQDSLEGLKNKTLLDALQFKTAYIGHSKSDLEGVVGFKYDLGSEMKDILENESALLTKAHYVLSERFYEQTGGEGSGQSAITLNQFCDDLGMPRKNGAHTPRNKERARSVFEVLTSTRISALAYLNGKKSPLRISDNMWKQGAEIEAQKRGRWHEHILTFTRGGFDDEWQKQNKKFIGYIHRGFLELKADNQDKYAILLGGYLASFAKMNQYQIQPLKLLPILKRVGLWNVYAEATPGKMREKLERSLDKLVSVGILREWRIEELSNVKRVVKQMSKAINYEEDYEEVGDNEHEAEPDKWVQVWLNKRLVIAYPFEFDERGKINKEKRVIYIKNNQKLKEKKRLSANKGSQTF